VCFDPGHEAADAAERGAVTSLISAAHASECSGRTSSVVNGGAKWGPGLETNEESRNQNREKWSFFEVVRG